MMALDYYAVTVAPTTIPVTLPDMKTWLGVSACEDNDFILALINAAVSKAEMFTNRVFIERTIKGTFSHLDCSAYEKGYFLRLRRSPVSSITSVKVIINDVLTAIDSSEYNFEESPGFPRIVFEEVNDSPDYVPLPYEVIFVAGYGGVDDVPDPIKVAIKQMVSYWYQQRGDCDGTDEMSPIAKSILGEYRILNTYG